MPIEIRELQIRVTINESEGMTATPERITDTSNIDTRRLVNECIEQVTEIINSKKER